MNQPIQDLTLNQRPGDYSAIRQSLGDYQDQQLGMYPKQELGKNHADQPS